MGEFIGEVDVRLLDDGRRLKLLNDFGFRDRTAILWQAPKDAVVDGASIPQIFWTITGGPLEGKYRNASILHDWYCDRRSRGWREVHRMFHEAMLVSGVSAAKAKIMYLAVYYRGPRWSDTTVDNAQLESLVTSSGGGASAVRGHASKNNAAYKNSAIATKSEPPPAIIMEPDLEEFKTLVQLVESGDRGLEDIDAIVDDRTTNIIR
jgi:Protein of unknown function (DUF1353)